ncbi:hypothetical protein GCM10011507_02330 [Edaphobacter acidisoli]|uniref:Uncharacterized protein n=1 Tax=Edaphobacter acidisoli TaxID=2040573 RepID=A0A916RHL5_9BACT|nr:hypothetical protein [Edaphobacter acidisoli]GGA54579.1 hypothetical protein GCM10011507_02330 [Edaphobacter acidisoli]
MKAGQTIQVIDTASKKYSGTFVSVSDTAMTIQQTSNQQSILKQDVRSVKIVKSSQRAKHAMIGAAAGAGAGAVTGAALGGCSGSCFLGSERGALAGIGAGIGAIVGAGVGAVLPSHGTTIYEASAH